MINPANPPSSLEYGLLLHTFNSSTTQPSYQTATDLTGRVLWYHPAAGDRIFRVLPGGTFLMNAGGQAFRETDLVGDVIRETSAARISEQLVELGKQSINSIHHETIRLPNGFTAMLCGNERLVTNVQGPGTVDVIGDAIVVLDTNLKVVWSWNGFDHLDVRRQALLGETCTPGGGAGCQPFHLAPIANDWLHSNSISYTPDGHFLVSVRHQDWVIKIDYANGSGTGRVIWRLGKDGDFTINSSDPYPWFSHQHDAEYELGGTQVLSLYDNGNTRRTQFPTANSRGQLYRLDEASRTASCY